MARADIPPVLEELLALGKAAGQKALREGAAGLIDSFLNDANAFIEEAERRIKSARAKNEAWGGKKKPAPKVKVIPHAPRRK